MLRLQSEPMLSSAVMEGCGYRVLYYKLGAVKHVVLPCNALDHKAATKQFVKKYPDATVWKYRASTVCLDRVVSSQQMWMREK